MQPQAMKYLSDLRQSLNSVLISCVLVYSGCVLIIQTPVLMSTRPVMDTRRYVLVSRRRLVVTFIIITLVGGIGSILWCVCVRVSRCPVLQYLSDSRSRW